MTPLQPILRQHGIYRNVPTARTTAQGLTALVTGANGVSGFNTVRALLDTPERWKTIYCISRKPPPPEMLKLLPAEAKSRLKVLRSDFLSEPSTIAKVLTESGVQPDHIYFYSYIHKDWSEAQALVDSNVKLFQNFVTALEIAQIRPARFILQTGGKNYGVHIGRTRTPLLESDPKPAHLLPNFYYPQEELLKQFCATHGAHWNVIMPCGVIGTSSQAAMNIFYLYGVYAAVQAHKGEPLIFGGDWEAWQFEGYYCSARMTGYLSEWAALEDSCKNENFNTQDGGPFVWERFLPELARWYGATGVVPPSDDESQLEIEAFGAAGRAAPLGYGPPLTSKTRFTLVDWARQDENAVAWREIMRQSEGRVTNDPFDDPDSFYMAKFAYLRSGSPCLNKARRMGWTGFVDTIESIFETFSEMASLGMLPEMRAESAKPLI